MSAYGHQHHDADDLRPTPARAAANEEPEHGGRGHMIGMVICCIPMVAVIIWVVLASR